MIDSTQITAQELTPERPGGDDHDLRLDDTKLAELSCEFVGRWSHLVSTTNWEKGRIICQWREALMGSECSTESCSDEAWSRRVGGVSSQHVGRLRRVYERYADSHASFSGLYWSHFLAALDWDDAELWLEGAVQSGWSVSQMRATRIESTGLDPESDSSHILDAAHTDDEDYVPLSEMDSSIANEHERETSEQAGPRYDEPDFGDDDSSRADNELQTSEDDLAPWEDSPTDGNSLESPFANLPSLPVDMAEALEQFKLAIIRHRAAGWSEVSIDDTTRTLDALKAFAIQAA